MKLLHYTTTYSAIILLALISIWAVIFYYAMFDEIYDSIDDGLDNRKMALINRAAKDTSFLYKPQLDEYLYTFEKVEFKNYKNFRDIYSDTLMYMRNEEDFEPVRMLESVFRHNDEYFKIKVATSMVEEDDQIRNLLKYTVLLYALLVVSILLINNFFLRKVWKPFYNVIAQLKDFSLEKNKRIAYPATTIEEFGLLNSSIEKLLQKTRESYEGQKQFIENASHELQTPLAIAINKLELFCEENQLTDTQAEQLLQALENLERLKRLNRSLLLISKIENDQFQQQKNVDINTLIETLISNFSEMATHKNISLHFITSGTLTQLMNPDLAFRLFSNLIKNAISHGNPNSEIKMGLTRKHFSISNLSERSSLDETLLFKRFHKFESTQNSTGLGLSIAKSISEIYHFALDYSYSNGWHTFTINFVMPTKSHDPASYS